MIRVHSVGVWGVKGYLVDIEVDVRPGLPFFDLLGLPGKSLRESRARVQSGIRSSGLRFPGQRVTVHLGPAERPKDGSGFDLAIALGILAASGQLPADSLQDVLCVGELGLDGSVKAVPQSILAAGFAEKKWKKAVLPWSQRAVLAGAGLSCAFAKTLVEAVQMLRSESFALPGQPPCEEPQTPTAAVGKIVGQAAAKRAMQLAAAGHHHILMIGPPGVGKSMLAETLADHMGPLNQQECLEVTGIHTIAGLNSSQRRLRRRPVQRPHPGIGQKAMLGGGSPFVPGEAVLAHRGVLILDELNRFSPGVLAGLLQPLEYGHFTLHSRQQPLFLPAKFVAAATMNPCPCGYRGDPTRMCRCRLPSIAAFYRRFSGALWDRFDLCVFLPPVTNDDYRRADCGYNEGHKGRSSPAGAENRGEAVFAPQALSFLQQAAAKMGLSARGREKTAAVARTAAWLDGAGKIETIHVGEALQYRFEALKLF